MFKTKEAFKMFEFIYILEVNEKELINQLLNMIERRASFHQEVLDHPNVTYKNGFYIYKPE